LLQMDVCPSAALRSARTYDGTFESPRVDSSRLETCAQDLGLRGLCGEAIKLL